jgi:hypothetical protein
MLMFAATSATWFSYASMLAADRADRVTVELRLAERAAKEAMPETQVKRAVSAGDVERVDELLSDGVDMSADDGQRLLAEAVKAEQWEIAARLLEAGANPGESSGPELIEFALLKGQSDLTRELVEAGAADDMSLVSPRVIGLAMRCGEKEIVEMLLEKAGSDEPGLLQRGGLFAQAGTLFPRGQPVDPQAQTARAVRFEYFVRCMFDHGLTPNQFEIHNLVVNTVRDGSPEFVEFVFGKLDTSQFSRRLSPLKLAVERGDEQILDIIRSALRLSDERRGDDRSESALLNAVQTNDRNYVQWPPSVGASP